MKKIDLCLSDSMISKDNVEKQLLKKFEYLNDPKQLHNLYVSYDYGENDENMVKVWEEILKYLFVNIFETFGMKISEIKN